ncbi:tRNA (guanosine(37)-N1)-methyltransferase TrmD [Ureaplasma sp. ES3154-GEN]|uniref:tRNA (guanosine(37)-N1)-methyltransferase TrmD n=1 Tax=Ureaplasma sp. ES3154-GEN TaxID=2984844 RepID=UPI0021E989E8|nr:tRNA (guanosine(37)-N1)-methyltransferase TrmD [Ureaplasma sp. ES3154-GEN]MCV3743662.1 tRNA (guanosine(37)-N1)-methyltransferase TrmD [Ureaplasma sp. ES3154-GEN]
MKISILTLFPGLYDNWLEHSIIKRARLNNKVDVQIVDMRDYATNKHRRVDDYPYGGGPGMVIAIDVVVNCLNAIKTPDSYVIYTSPRGKRYEQPQALWYAQNIKHLIIITGHYEGIDERIKYYVDAYLSIGDFVLTGGELVSMMVADSIIRLLDGVINQESLVDESFNNNLLDYPVYTKPLVFDGHSVPQILLSGHHAEINKYRKQAQENLTKTYRNDLYQKYLENKK